MVNENKGSSYNPVPHWDRKLVRSVIRNQVIKQGGYHNVSERMSAVFKQMQSKEKESM